MAFVFSPNIDSRCEAAGTWIYLQCWFDDPTNLLITYSPTSGDRNRLLRASEEQFGKSDESAYSIVPSRMSMSIYTGQTIDSGTSKSEVDLVYKPLTFENELFTARVYKRNYRTPTLQRLFKGTEQQTSDKTRSRTVAREIAEDPNGSEADACTIREPGPTRWWRTKAQNAEPRIPFADACEQGNVEIVEASLKSGQDVHLPVVRENQKLLDLSAIHVAAKGGHVKVVEILLRYGADKEMLSRVSQQRPLHVAVRAGHVAMAKYLLDNGTNVVALDSAGAQAIHLAAARRSTEMLSLLLERGAAIDSAVSTGYQPLHIASNIPDRANVIRFLCSQGADIEAKTHRGCTPLFYASARNYADNMKALLELGAAHIPQGLSDPSIMVQRSYLQATRLLLERGVDPNCPVYGERTALRRLAKALIVVSSESYTSHKFADVVELLVDLRDSNGDTPLHCLCRIRENPMSEQEELQLQLATILLRSTKDVDTINLAGDTALGLSIKRRCGISLIQSVFDSGGRLLLTKTEIKLRFEIDGSSAAYGSFLTCHLRRGDHVLTIRVNNYYKADQDSPHVLSPSSIGVLRGLLQDPESIDVNDGSWSYDNGAYVPAAQ